MPTEFPAINFDPDRVKNLMGAKRFSIDEYLDAGFDRAWIQRKSKVVPPRDYRKIFRLALWLEVPAEYLVGAAPEYDGMPAWEVASRASLELFFKRHAEGREASQFRRDLENHRAARGEAAPRTIATWAGVFDSFQRGRARERSDAHRLEETAQGDQNS